MKVCCIASGSSGNCVYINEGDTHILVDAGVSRKRIVDSLKQINVTPDMLTGIFVTHEHIDHIKGIKILEKMYNIDLYATNGTFDGIRKNCNDILLDSDKMHVIHADEEVVLNDLTILPFNISHDANEPVGFTIESQTNRKFSIVTDLGKYDDYTLNHVKDSEMLYVEANYDESMIETGPYPYHLKRRIQSERGHLSNVDSGNLICDVLSDRLKIICLAHLSKENNMPEIACETVKCTFWERTGMQELPFQLFAAKRNEMSEMFVL